MSKNEWFVYVVKCSDDSYYTGVSTNVERRLQEHNSKKTGAAYTRSRRPVVLIHVETAKNRSKALSREAEIKKMTHDEKAKFENPSPDNT